MPTLRNSIPALKGGCRLLGSKSIHTSSSFRAAPSPRVTRAARKQRPAQGALNSVQVQGQISSDPEEALPPRNLLDYASKSGALDVPPDKALDILRSYQELARRGGVGWEESVCTSKPSPLIDANQGHHLIYTCRP